MPVPKDKNDLILAIESSYSKLKTDLNSIPSELTNEKDRWSCKRN